MENGETPANYRTQVPVGGAAAGFDLYSGTPSCKYYNSTSDSWAGIADANNLIYNPEGYMVFVEETKKL